MASSNVYDLAKAIRQDLGSEQYNTVELHKTKISISDVNWERKIKDEHVEASEVVMVENTSALLGHGHIQASEGPVRTCEIKFSHGLVPANLPGLSTKVKMEVPDDLRAELGSHFLVDLSKETKINLSEVATPMRAKGTVDLKQNESATGIAKQKRRFYEAAFTATAKLKKDFVLRNTKCGKEELTIAPVGDVSWNLRGLATFVIQDTPKIQWNN